MLQYFTDPVLRAPVIGSMLMCFSSALVGVLVYLRRQSLLGEALSHAAYPGIVIGVLAAAPLSFDGSLSIAVLMGATISALLAMFVIEQMQQKLRVQSDAALCFVLAAFFGLGVLFSSRIQLTHTELYVKMRAYIYGQPATMTDVHIIGYGILSFVVLGVISALFKEMQAQIFDRDYAKVQGLPVKKVDTLFIALLVFAVVVGIRAVGVVLMAAMLIAPAVAARQLTRRMGSMLCIAAVVGLASGFFGNYLSIEGQKFWGLSGVSLPTGPLIVICSSGFAFLSLLFAPERGFLGKVWRRFVFRARCIEENMLKTLWREGGRASFTTLFSWQSISTYRFRMLLGRLQGRGWIVPVEDGFALTEEGQMRAARIIRLHRLWELYLTECLGVSGHRVHESAEEMDHILTDEMEHELTQLLADPKKDPHRQPIPPHQPEKPKEDSGV